MLSHIAWLISRRCFRLLYHARSRSAGHGLPSLLASQVCLRERM